MGGSFRGVSSEELQKESENKDGIELALRQAKRAMLSGNTMRAVSTLEAIKKVMCPCAPAEHFSDRSVCGITGPAPVSSPIR